MTASTPVTSLHTHNLYCDGSSSIEAMIQAAVEAGLTEIGISSHAPLPFPTAWTMPLERLTDYVSEVCGLRQKYADQITVRLGLEFDRIPDAQVEAFQQQHIRKLGAEYFVGSVHFLGPDYPPGSYEADPGTFRAILEMAYGGDIRSMVFDYYTRVGSLTSIPDVKIIGHLDRIKRWNNDRSFFDPGESWYRQEVERALQAIRSSGQIVEFNTSGWRNGLDEPYPALWILARCRDLHIPVLITADAHAPDQVNWGFARAAECLQELGIEPVYSVFPG